MTLFDIIGSSMSSLALNSAFQRRDIFLLDLLSFSLRYSAQVFLSAFQQISINSYTSSYLVITISELSFKSCL